MNILNLFKRKSDFDEPDPLLEKGAGERWDGGSEQANPTFNPPQFDPHEMGPQMPGPAYQTPRGNEGSDMMMIRKEIELVSAKMDNLKTMMESINQRLYNLERVAYGHHDRKW